MKISNKESMKTLLTFFKAWAMRLLVGLISITGMIASILIATLIVKIGWSIIVFTWGIW